VDHGAGAPALVDLIRLRRASTYGAGQGLDQVIDVCGRLAGYGIPAIVGYFPTHGESTRVAADVQLQSFGRLTDAGLDGHVAVKLNGIDFDPGLFSELADAAAQSGLRFHIDGLTADTVGKTFALLAAIPRSGPIGTTLPGRWKRSVGDAAAAMQLGVSVRVVKGHWSDPVGGSVDPRRGFLDVVDRLCGYQGGVGIATHDAALLHESLRRLIASDTPCEAQLLLGLPFRRPADEAHGFGVPIRVYVPYGDAWPGYGIRDLATHPKTALWLVQDLVYGKDKTWRSIRRDQAAR
jgi:proline dehydrogenase